MVSDSVVLKCDSGWARSDPTGETSDLVTAYGMIHLSKDGREMAAWIYWYIGPLDRGVPIPGGDYRAHAPGTSIYHQPSP